jgi:hypothetical protein
VAVLRPTVTELVEVADLRNYWRFGASTSVVTLPRSALEAF